MLEKLYIRNYAIIDEISISFSENLNVITGETGAGKSILMGALSLILGERAESGVLRDSSKKCIVEGYFKTTSPQVKALLAGNELENGEELILRREIAPNGKSRAFINDTPVNLSQLKELCLLLVDLHQQFDTLELGGRNFQREILDALADNNKLLVEFRHYYLGYQEKKQFLESLVQQQKEANLTLDYHRFLYDELEQAGLRENELELLDEELKILSNAESIKLQLGSIFNELMESEQPIVQQLKSLVNRLHALRPFYSSIEEITNRLQSVHYEMTDIADTIARMNDSVKYDPERLLVINEKIALGYKLLKKHNVNRTAELLAIRDLLQQKLDNIFNIEEQIAAHQKAVQEALSQSNQLAAVISNNRKKTIAPFVDSINSLLSKVGMPNAFIKIEMSPSVLSPFGSDEIVFLFDANKSNRFEALSKVASGGELSRIMLCIKFLIAQKLQLPVLIFDEIDTGISGEAAKQVGIIMKELANKHQVITITHQPQIAAKANTHFFVYKQPAGNHIATAIKRLGKEEQVQAIARMLAGENPTAVAIKNAKEMIGN